MMVGTYGRGVAAAALTAVLALLASDPAAAEDRRVKVINETSYTVVEFYGSNAGSRSWEEDVLGEDVLLPGQSVIVNFDDGSGYCRFDFLARFEDGDEVEKHDIDVCEIGVFRLTE